MATDCSASGSVTGWDLSFRPAPVASGDERAPLRARVLKGRVLHIIDGDHYADAERVQDLIVQQLPACGYEVGLVALEHGEFARMRHSKAPLAEVPMRRRFDLAAAATVARLAVDGRYRLIHTHSPHGLMVGRAAAALARLPLVHQVHSPMSQDSTRPWLNRISRMLESLCIAGAARVIAVSSDVAKTIPRRRGSKQPLRVVPGGVPSAGPLTPRSTPTHRWVLGTVGLIRPRKGFETLIEALGLLRRSGRNVELRAVGSFETEAYQRDIKLLAERLGVASQIKWRGDGRDLTPELAAMDLFVLPGLTGEGTPIALLEAMAAGVPVVASRVEGVRQMIRHGAEGLLVEPGSAQAIAAAIVQVMAGEYSWASLRKKAHRRHSQRYTDHTMAAGIARIYNELLAQPRV